MSTSTDTLADVLREADALQHQPEVQEKKAKPTATVQPSKPTSSVASIDKDVPIPAITMPDRKIYPLSDMEVGDSFKMEAEDKRAMTNRLRSAITQYQKRGGKDRKFITRRENDGVRCWRIE